MTEPNEFELLELATPYALDAVSDEERAEIERRVAAAPRSVAAAFDDEVRAIRETMAVVSATTAVEPPARLRAATLSAIPARDERKYGWRTAGLAAAAAAVVVGAAAFGVGIFMRPHPPSTIAEQVFAAPDVRTVSGPLGNGTATVVFSHDRNAGVLVMNNVPPPKPGTVYQMWLLSDKGPTSAGTMGTAAVAPSTTATLTNLGSSTTLAFTVEPGTGSPRPTGTILAALPLG
ncbi:anti-sigma factor [Mycobacterium sp. 852002-53434_SCH5985345]|uniref:anti-sigma factor n=1 Tax=unclassified Mycobacterium TaxID=2642494 RepID=UPI0008018858|nr:MULTISPECIES: anti-sigma factor [unclassified Mycobacterium]OBF58345.1 anti-sigma factor [Mycobacterium sp. 852002-53434_SCH5985345]OBF71370.1 anti-sigma factor [Mycobacterium sp. 852002-51613_SCH5001154]